jgi:hypothetical protein
MATIGAVGLKQKIYLLAGTEMKKPAMKACLVSGLFALFALACTEDAQQVGDAAQGQEGQACRADGSCETGLMCVSDLCVRLPDGGDSGGLDDVGDDGDDGGVADATDSGDDAPDTPSDSGGDAEDTNDTNDLSDGGDTADAQPQNPTCTIDAPADGAAKPFEEEWTFQATATDPQDGALSGGSVRWESDLAGTLGTGETIQHTFSLSGTHVIECVATDSDGNSSSAQISVTVESPRAEIFHPSDGETRAANSQIPFTGRGFDAEDGNLSGTSLVWTSSIDGQFGTGEDFRAKLSAGTNVVTLTVTDADGNTASTSITLSIQ